MGKASSRKALKGAALVAGDKTVGPGTDADVARSVLDCYEAFNRARHYSVVLSESMQSPKVRRWFHGLSLSLGDVQRLLALSAREAQKTLGLPVSVAGTDGKGADGSTVSVALDGVVQHSAPDDVLRELGLKPPAKSGDVRKRKGQPK